MEKKGKSLPVEIKSSVLRYEAEKRRAAFLYDKAAELIEERGTLDHVDPKNDRTIQIFVVTEIVDGVRFRVWIDKKANDTIPPKDKMGAINLDFIPEDSNSVYVNRLAELRLEGKGSEFFGSELRDSNLLRSYRDELELTEKVLAKVFGA